MLLKSKYFLFLSLKKCKKGQTVLPKYKPAVIVTSFEDRASVYSEDLK